MDVKILQSDMEEKMKNSVRGIVSQGFKIESEYEDIAKYIKDECDKKFGAGCLVLIIIIVIIIVVIVKKKKNSDGDLVKEVEGMILKQNDFESTLSVFERIRFDFTLISNIAENALFNYIKDMGTLCKLKRYSSEYSKLNNMIFATKMKNYKSQNKTKERQRKLRIDDCLSNHYNIDIKMNKKFKGSRKFKSLMETATPRK